MNIKKYRLTAGRGSTGDLPVMLTIPIREQGRRSYDPCRTYPIGKNLVVMGSSGILRKMLCERGLYKTSFYRSEPSLVGVNPAYSPTLKKRAGLERDRKGFGLPSRQPAILILALAMTLFTLTEISASSLSRESKGGDYSDEQIVNAIYKAEGGSKAKVPYGILSVKVKDEKEARQICFNTVRNNRVRFIKQSKYSDFIEFLGSRYCPVGASNDPNGLNRNWVKNVKGFLEKK